MVNPNARGYLEEIQKAGKHVDMEQVFIDEVNEEQVQKTGAQLYAMMTSLVTGEAMTVVRGVGQETNGRRGSS